LRRGTDRWAAPHSWRIYLDYAVYKMRGGTTLFALVVAPLLSASTARLSCIADITEAPDVRVNELGLRPAALLNFRLDPVRNWRIDKASLMVHLARGETPDELDVAVIRDKWSEKRPASRHRYAFLIHPVHTEADGWLSVPLRQAIVDDLLSGKVWGLAISGTSAAWLHSRESITFAPYLLIEGHPPAQPRSEPVKIFPPSAVKPPETPTSSPGLPSSPEQKLRK
jgi:hypothetical protein